MSKVLTSRRGWFAITATTLGTALLSGCTPTKTSEQINGKTYQVVKAGKGEYALCPDGVCDFSGYKARARLLVKKLYEDRYEAYRDDLFKVLSSGKLGAYDLSKPLVAVVLDCLTYNELLTKFFDTFADNEVAYNSRGTTLDDFVENLPVAVYSYDAQHGYRRVAFLYKNSADRLLNIMSEASNTDLDRLEYISEDKMFMEESTARALNAKVGSA